MAQTPLPRSDPPDPGPAYRVNCYRPGPQSVCGLSEWHTTLGSALDALLAHQQRYWSCVALVPQVALAPHHEQLVFPLKESV